MKTKFFTVNFITKEITGSERAFNRAGRGYEAEQTELTSHIKNNPDFKLVIAESEKKKTTYEGLNLAFVKEYVALNDPDRMPELEALAKNYKFPTIRKWFLENYKKNGVFNVNKEKRNIREAKTKRNIETARKSVFVRISQNSIVEKKGA